MISPARELAFRVLLEVESGGFAADSLAVRAIPLNSRDAGLASSITLGTLRFQAQIDFLIAQLAGRSIVKLDPEVRAALRIGAFQLHYLDRIPAHAAVGESVELVKLAKKRSAAGFVNAVLRKITRQAPVWPDRSVALSCPEWMLARWTGFWGEEAAASVARAALATPPRYLRLAEGSPISGGILPTDVPGCFELPAGIETPPGARLQDIGSQSIVPLLELRPEHRFLDVCAAPGNKTAQAKESGAWTIAADISLKRLQTLPETRVVLDARRGLPFTASFDRILVDAPCSGTGTLAHNPEIKWRLSLSAIDRQSERQRQILQQALGVLAPGGLLVYSTCSLEPEENEAVVEAVAPRRVLRTVRRFPGRDSGDGFFAAVLR